MNGISHSTTPSRSKPATNSSRAQRFFDQSLQSRPWAASTTWVASDSERSSNREPSGHKTSHGVPFVTFGGTLSDPTASPNFKTEIEAEAAR